MSHAATAEQLFHDLQQMPETERARFFAILGQQAFRDENASHDEVFGHLADDEFTAQEAAEYLEISLSTFRRYVASGKLASSNEVGRNQMFATRDLKAFKRSLKDIKG